MISMRQWLVGLLIIACLILIVELESAPRVKCPIGQIPVPIGSPGSGKATVICVNSTLAG